MATATALRKGGKPGKRKPNESNQEQKQRKKSKKAISEDAQDPRASLESGDVDDFEGQFLELGDSAGDEQPAAEEVAEGAAKKQKKRRKGKGQKLTAAEFEASRNLAVGIATCPPEEQADWLWRSFCLHTGATALERDGLTAGWFVALPAAGSLEDQLKAVEPEWWSEFASVAGKSPGQPSVLLVSPSAMGAVHMIKSCQGLNRSCRVAKLFAKHFKVAEQEAMLRKERVCMGVGTPNRLCKLADSGALRLGSLKWIILDVHMDAKQRTILDIPEVRADWWAVWQQHLREKVTGGQARIALYCGQGGDE